MKERIVILVKAGLVGGAFLTLSAFSVQAEFSARTTARETTCGSHLKQIGAMAELYRKCYGHYEFPSETGTAWHWRLIQTVSQNQDTSIWRCPSEGWDTGSPDYRGPSKNLNWLKNYMAQDPIAGDKLDNHGDRAKYGVTALTKGYQVFKITTGDRARWQMYLQGTSE